MISSNCDHLKLYLFRDGAWTQFAEADPDRLQFPHLQYAPFTVDIEKALGWKWGDLKIEGYVDGQLKLTRLFSGRGVDRQFMLAADDAELAADGADCTRVVLRVTDEYGNARPFANDAVALALEGPADLVGDNPFVLVGGAGAVWIRAREEAGTVKLTATHPRLGPQTVTVRIVPAPPETA